MAEIKIIQGDITKLQVDAIVNAANRTLLGGGGVDGAIHAPAGPKLKEECAGLGGCDFGEAKITKGFDLPSKFVIHTVGPIWRKHGPELSKKLLAECYTNCLKLADENKLQSIAFPAISTGAYGFPIELATQIAYEAIQKYLAGNPGTSLEEITLVTFSDSDLTVYQKEFAAKPH